MSNVVDIEAIRLLNEMIEVFNTDDGSGVASLDIVEGEYICKASLVLLGDEREGRFKKIEDAIKFFSKNMYELNQKYLDRLHQEGELEVMPMSAIPATGSVHHKVFEKLLDENMVSIFSFPEIWPTPNAQAEKELADIINDLKLGQFPVEGLS